MLSAVFKTPLVFYILFCGNLILTATLVTWDSTIFINQLIQKTQNIVILGVAMLAGWILGLLVQDVNARIAMFLASTITISLAVFLSDISPVTAGYVRYSVYFLIISMINKGYPISKVLAPAHSHQGDEITPTNGVFIVFSFLLGSFLCKMFPSIPIVGYTIVNCCLTFLLFLFFYSSTRKYRIDPRNGGEVMKNIRLIVSNALIKPAIKKPLSWVNDILLMTFLIATTYFFSSYLFYGMMGTGILVYSMVGIAFLAYILSKVHATIDRRIRAFIFIIIIFATTILIGLLLYFNIWIDRVDRYPFLVGFTLIIALIVLFSYFRLMLILKLNT